MQDPIWLLEILILYYEEIFVKEDAPDCPLGDKAINAIEEHRSGNPLPACQFYRDWAKETCPDEEALRTTDLEILLLELQYAVHNYKNKRIRALYWLKMAKQLE